MSDEAKASSEQVLLCSSPRLHQLLEASMVLSMQFNLTLASLGYGLPLPWKEPSEGIAGVSALASKGVRASSSASSLTAFLGLAPSVR